MRDVRPTMPAKRAPARSRPRLWLLPLAVAAGAVAAWIAVAALRPPPTRTVSEVREEIAQLILRKSDRPNATDGGAIGPWWISAQSGDAARGEFADFYLRSGSMQVAAKSARLIIDPDAGTFRFDLREVVVMRVPEGDGEEASVAHMERHTLGPVALRGRVVYDPAMPSVVRARE